MMATPRSRVIGLARYLDNENTPVCETAAANLDAGKPAFWSTAGYSNQVAGSILWYANHHASVCDGLDEFAPICRPHDARDQKYLDQLLPLNEAAVTDLQAAYRRVGTFRAKTELIKRTERLEDRIAVDLAPTTRMRLELGLISAEADIAARELVEGA